MKSSVRNKNIILGVSGGIAAYKSVELVRRLVKLGARVRVIMTESATRFVGPLTFETLSENKVCTGLFNEKDDAGIRHIQWADEASAVVIAPATANTIGKLANGLADDALSTFMLAVTCPVLICPSMNTNMYLHPAVQANLDQLKDQGCHILSPGEGDLACGIQGPGRLPEPWQIADRVESLLSPNDLDGKHVLVTAGPTREALDPVRFLSNPSSGKMGYAVARAAEQRGATVTLVTGPVALDPPLNVETIPVISVDEMAEAVLQRLDRVDVVVKVAAVSDYTPEEKSRHKIKKSPGNMTVTFKRTTDILKAVARKKKSQVVVGFAAETRDLEKNAVKKLAEKNLDMIAANLIGSPDSGFGADTNRMTLYFRNGEKKAIDLMDKADVADTIINHVIQLL